MAEDLQLKISCKQGSIQITKDGALKVVQPLTSKVLWETPCKMIIRMDQTKPTWTGLSVIFISRLGSYTCDVISKENFAKLQGVLAANMV